MTKPSDRSKIVRSPNRAHYDTESLNKVLDDGYICHVAYDYHGSPVIIPTAYVREDDVVYIHGAKKNRMMNSLLEQGKATIAVTHLDGMVLARSAFHHSFNYRSAAVFGKPFAVEFLDEKRRILEMITENILPGRWDEVRQPTTKELEITLVIGIRIQEASVKIRAGRPVDDDEDYKLPIWAGEFPLELRYTDPVTDDAGIQDLDLPESVKNLLGKQ